MIDDYALKREALRRLIAQARHAQASAADVEARDEAGTWCDVLIGIDEDLLRAHGNWHRAAEIEDALLDRALVSKRRGGASLTDEARA